MGQAGETPIQVDLIEKVAFNQSLKRGEGVSQANIWGLEHPASKQQWM